MTMENQDPSAPQDSPGDTPAARPPVRIRRADAPPTFERVADKGAETPLTHYRPAKPPGAGRNALELIMPVGVTLALVAAGWFAFRMEREQREKLLSAEAGAAGAEAAFTWNRSLLADTKTEVGDLLRNIPLEAVKAKRDAETKAAGEFAEEFATLTREIGDARDAAREAARKAEDALRAQLAELRTKADGLRQKSSERKAKIRETQLWLNDHTRTSHPKY